MPLSDRVPLNEGGVAAEFGAVSPRLHRPILSAAEQTETAADEDGLRQLMAVQRLPGSKSKAQNRVRWYHQTFVEGQPAICYAFSLPAAAHRDFEAGKPLRADGATFPDGMPVVPVGTHPRDVVVRCGSCGSEQVEFLHLRFYWD